MSTEANVHTAQTALSDITPHASNSSRNAVKLGLFGATAFVPASEREEYEEFCSDYLLELKPKTAVEDTLADEIIQAAWRLRRCAAIEQQELPEDVDPEQLDRIQQSIDRARATAQRVYHKSLIELRRVRAEAKAAKDAAWKKEVDEAFQHNMQLGRKAYAEATKRSQPATLKSMDEIDAAIHNLMREDLDPEITKQSQSAPATAPRIARNAPCPCNSGEKYKRCCGKTAPPVLGHAA